MDCRIGCSGFEIRLYCHLSVHHCNRLSSLWSTTVLPIHLARPCASPSGTAVYICKVPVTFHCAVSTRRCKRQGSRHGTCNLGDALEILAAAVQAAELLACRAQTSTARNCVELDPPAERTHA